MKLSLGFSPCPNDTFIFDAMVHGKIDTEGLEFEVRMEDVEALNKAAFDRSIDITKLSYHAFAHLTEDFTLLQSGSALGNNCGPLLVAREKLPKQQWERLRIAIPGKMTTANFLLGLVLPKAEGEVEMLFSDIEDAVVGGEVDAGLIIHENRFTYRDKGLVKLIDLGEYWETQTGLPIPLGGIVMRSNLPPEIKDKVQRVMHRSVVYAFDHPEDVLGFVKEHAQAMEEPVMKAHIDLYVNEYTVELGATGQQAIKELFRQASRKGLIPSFRENFME